jgi:hypothetical protein
MPPRRRAVVVGILGGLCLGCRLPMAPFIGVAWLAGMSADWSWRQAAAVTASAVAALALTVGPFVAADPGNFWFWAGAFHRTSVALRNFNAVPAEVWGLAPALWLGVAATVAAWATRATRVASRELWLAAAIGCGLAGNLLPRGAYAEYAAPLVPAALLLAVWICVRAWPRRFVAGATVAAGVAVLSAWFSPPPTDPDIYPQVREAARALDAVLPPGRECDGPATLLALETNRPVHPRLLMTPFSLTEDLAENAAAARHLATPRWLDERLRDPALDVYALTSQPRWNFGRSMPDFRFTSPGVLKGWSETLQRDYRAVFANGGFVIFARRHPSSAQATR